MHQVALRVVLTADQTVDVVALVEEELREVEAVLTGDPGDERTRHGSGAYRHRRRRNVLASLGCGRCRRPWIHGPWPRRTSMSSLVVGSVPSGRSAFSWREPTDPRRPRGPAARTTSPVSGLAPGSPGRSS